jgi:hypothetical protein
VTNDTIRDVRQRAEDAAYTAVGVGVLGFQQAQVRRRAVQGKLAGVAREARQQAEALTGEAKAAVESIGTDVKERVEPFVSQLGGRVDPFVADVRARVEPVIENLSESVRRVVGTPPAPTKSSKSSTKS